MLSWVCHYVSMLFLDSQFMPHGRPAKQKEDDIETQYWMACIYLFHCSSLISSGHFAL